jgi:hypothetical protein
MRVASQCASFEMRPTHQAGHDAVLGFAPARGWLFVAQQPQRRELAGFAGAAAAPNAGSCASRSIVPRGGRWLRSRSRS